MLVCETPLENISGGVGKVGNAPRLSVARIAMVPPSVNTAMRGLPGSPISGPIQLSSCVALACLAQQAQAMFTPAVDT